MCDNYKCRMLALTFGLKYSFLQETVPKLPKCINRKASYIKLDYKTVYIQKIMLLCTFTQIRGGQGV